MYITGAEFVTDAWRRKGKEGVLDRSTKRRKRSVPDALQELADGVLWYTAPFVPATTGEPFGAEVADIRRFEGAQPTLVTETDTSVA
jgi:hypothetical protein